MSTRMLSRTVLTASVLFVCCAVPLAVQADPVLRYYHIHHAMHELKEARVELKESRHDFGGHRELALQAVDAAFYQLDRCLEAAGERYVGFRVEVGIYRGYEHHPHLQHALRELKEARIQLSESRHNFGGHRDQAIRDLDYAIVQIEICLRHYNG
jgi:hypothetical protein